MKPLKAEWVHSKAPYTDWTYEIDPKALKLLELYPFFFDDEYWYWHPKTRKGVLNRTILKRAPLWTYPNKSCPAESPKVRLKDPHQLKLEASIARAVCQKS
jgi:hypothetical protein